jgi:hypothetical protein
MHSENCSLDVPDPCPDDPADGPWAREGGIRLRHAFDAAFATAGLSVGKSLLPFWMMN